MFDAKKLSQAKLEPRVEVVQVEELKEFFTGKPQWTVRGLTGEEMHRVKESSNRDTTVSAAISAMYGNLAEKTGAFRALFGTGDGVTEEYSKRIELLTVGSHEPKIDRQVAVKIATCFPATLTKLTDAILNLTGMGHQVGKRKGSGPTDGSETP